MKWARNWTELQARCAWKESPRLASLTAAEFPSRVYSLQGQASTNARDTAGRRGTEPELSRSSVSMAILKVTISFITEEGGRAWTSLSAAGALFRIQEAEHNVEDRDPGRDHDVHHDGLHRVRESIHPQGRGHACPSSVRGHVPGGGVRHHFDGRVCALPDRARAGHGVECVFHVHGCQ